MVHALASTGQNYAWLESSIGLGQFWRGELKPSIKTVDGLRGTIVRLLKTQLSASLWLISRFRFEDHLMVRVAERSTSVITKVADAGALKLYARTEMHIMSWPYLAAIAAGSYVSTIGEFNVHTLCRASLNTEHYQQYRITKAHKRQFINELTKKSVKKSDYWRSFVHRLHLVVPVPTVSVTLTALWLCPVSKSCSLPNARR